MSELCRGLAHWRDADSGPCDCTLTTPTSCYLCGDTDWVLWHRCPTHVEEHFLCPKCESRRCYAQVHLARSGEQAPCSVAYISLANYSRLEREAMRAMRAMLIPAHLTDERSQATDSPPSVRERDVAEIPISSPLVESLDGGKE